MGLLKKAQLQKLMDAGITRYHCNLESSADYFGTLCTSHTPADKIETIRAAQEIGMEVCSGGIIGMGESMEDRIDLPVYIFIGQGPTAGHKRKFIHSIIGIRTG